MQVNGKLKYHQIWEQIKYSKAEVLKAYIFTKIYLQNNCSVLPSTVQEPAGTS
jgi:hypothetical protein